MSKFLGQHCTKRKHYKENFFSSGYLNDAQQNRALGHHNCWWKFVGTIKSLGPSVPRKILQSSIDEDFHIKTTLRRKRLLL